MTSSVQHDDHHSVQLRYSITDLLWLAALINESRDQFAALLFVTTIYCSIENDDVASLRGVGKGRVYIPQAGAFVGRKRTTPAALGLDHYPNPGDGDGRRGCD